MTKSDKFNALVGFVRNSFSEERVVGLTVKVIGTTASATVVVRNADDHLVTYRADYSENMTWTTERKVTL